MKQLSVGMSRMNSIMIMTLFPLCCASRQQAQKQCQCKALQAGKALQCLCTANHRYMSTDSTDSGVIAHSGVIANDYYAEHLRVRFCDTHKISSCPICNSDDYIRRRVCNVVSGSLKRLNLKKSMSFLDYLGADSWPQVLLHMQEKRENWNKLHPNAPMTLTNTALDHIRPVSSFKRNTQGAQNLLCNHFTNLQPLLHEDNNWKGEVWTPEDEKFWHENIILQPAFKNIYYPKTAPSQPSLLCKAS